MNRKLFNSNDRYKNLAEILIESFLIIGKEEELVTAVHHSLHKIVKINNDKLVKFGGAINTKMQHLYNML